MQKITARFLFATFACLLLHSIQLRAQQWDTLSPIPENFTFPVVVVANGKIHIMGGGGTGGATDHHFSYDPQTDAWEPRAPVPYLAQQPAGAAAGNKIHYFGGGYPTSGQPQTDHFIYDDVTDSWSQAADLDPKRAIHYGVALNDVIYTLAGQGVATLFQSYDDTADVWITLNNLPDAGFWYGAHVVSEGHIYRFCGGGYTAPNKLAHRYDPETDSWTSLMMFPAATHGISGAAIGSKIYLAGGYHDFLDRDEVFIYDTQTGQYTAGVPLPIGRTYHNMVAIDSCFYVLGGNNAIDPTVSTQLLRFCPGTVTSVQGISEVRHLNVYYDTDILRWQLPVSENGAVELSLYNTAGQIIYHHPSLSINEVYIGEVASGLYFVEIKTTKGNYIGRVFAEK